MWLQHSVSPLVSSAAALVSAWQGLAQLQAHVSIVAQRRVVEAAGRPVCGCWLVVAGHSVPLLAAQATVLLLTVAERPVRCLLQTSAACWQAGGQRAGVCQTCGHLLA